MPIKSEKMKISKNKKMRFFLMSQGSFNPKIRFLVEKVCPVACLQTDRQTDRQTHRVTTEGTLSGFQDFFLEPIIKDQPNKRTNSSKCLAEPVIYYLFQTIFSLHQAACGPLLASTTRAGLRGTSSVRFAS